MATVRIREIRINPVIPAESVLIATERAGRVEKKIEPFQHETQSAVENCQFCRGNELHTPEEIVRLPGGGDWNIRVVRNLYPVFGDDNTIGEIDLGIHHIIEGYGRHEVIIDHANHGIQVCEMEVPHLAMLFRLYRDRMMDLYRVNEAHKYVLVFKNFGPASGGSIAHTHSQIIAMPVIPANVELEIDSSLKFYRKNKECIFCALIDEHHKHETTVYDMGSKEEKRRIDTSSYHVEVGNSFIAIKPFASRYPWEIHILPRQHNHDYRTVSDEECLDLARVMRRVMLRLQNVLGIVQYNYFLHSAPALLKAPECAAGFHWHIEICPRTTIPNGFELGSGLAINSVSPEEAAQRLREVSL